MWITLWKNIICNLENGSKSPGKPVKQAETADLHKKSRNSYVNRLSTKKSTCISVEKHQKACG